MTNVSQEAREAAGAWLRDIDGQQVQHILDGMEDDCSLVQAFAQFQRQIEAATVERLPVKFDPRDAKRWWNETMESQFVSARLSGDGYVKFQWRDKDETGDYSVPWIRMTASLAAIRAEVKP